MGGWLRWNAMGLVQAAALVVVLFAVMRVNVQGNTAKNGEQDAAIREIAAINRETAAALERIAARLDALEKRQDDHHDAIEYMQRRLIENG